MDGVVINKSAVGGMIESVEFGFEPYHYAIITVRSAAMVWDRFGNRTQAVFNPRIVLQGKENVSAYRSRLKKGYWCYAEGQQIPIRYVAGDSQSRGNVVLASEFQVSKARFMGEEEEYVRARIDERVNF